MGTTKNHQTSKPSRCKRLGRPPLPRDEVRSCRVVTFVTENELDQLQLIAQERDESISATVHRFLSDKLTGLDL